MSLYKDFIWRIKLKLSNDYPIWAPHLNFMDPIFHPNIWFETGEVCADILKEKW